MEVFPIDVLIYAIPGLVIGIIAGYFIRRYIGEGKIKNAEELAKKITEDSIKDGEARKKELLLEALSMKKSAVYEAELNKVEKALKQM